MLINISRRLSTLGLLVLVFGCGGEQVGTLVAQLDHVDVENRRAAARALAELANRDDRAVAALTASLGDSDVKVRQLSIYALGNLGTAAKRSVPALERALGDAEPFVRLRAALAIQKIEPANSSFAPVLMRAMREGDGRITLAVGEMREDAAWAVPTLRELLSHQSAKIRVLAARTLGRIGPPAASAKAALELLLRDRDVAVQHAAREALDRIEGHVQAAGRD
jgi:HEAT repeat protein